MQPNAYVNNWTDEAKCFNKMAEKVNKAYQQSKLSYSQIDSRMDTCIRAHIGEWSVKSYTMKALTDKKYNTNEAYNNTFKAVSCSVDNLHNYIYCMEGLFR
ncbi:uncharacterized protein LOC109601111 [Aethina tumida]|uniref:uncharacterized protein LOC109601111 n=1 Tax=Aethina tumida TaxID=116153 RepID=UPI00096B3E2C|nr:uncharacterized protein LOC109601111 [Aethina tumida]